MSDSEKLTALGRMVDETDDDVLSTFLDLAGQEVCRRAFPFHPEITAVPDRYVDVQLKVAAYLINKRGAEGETSHSENGVSRSYEDGDIPPSMFRSIIPMAGVL